MTNKILRINEEFAPEEMNGLHRLLSPRGHHIDVLLEGFSASYDSKNILVCFSGAITNRKNKIPPFFSGASIAKDLSIPLISFSDPTLEIDENTSLAWYAGNSHERQYFKIMAEYIDLISEKEKKKPILFGGSGGGFAAIATCSEMNAAADLMVWNPQTSIADYDKTHVANYIKTAFGVTLLDGFYEFLNSTIPIHDLKTIKIPENKRIIYLQNSSDWHTKKHCLPFMKKQCDDWSPIGKSLFASQNEKIIIYIGDWGVGHTPPPPQSIRSLIASIAIGPENLAKVGVRMDLGLIPGLSTSKSISHVKKNSINPSQCKLKMTRNGLVASIDCKSEHFNEFAFLLQDYRNATVCEHKFSKKKLALFQLTENISDHRVVFLWRDFFGNVGRVTLNIESLIKEELFLPQDLFQNDRKMELTACDAKDANTLRQYFGEKFSAQISDIYLSLQKKGTLNNFVLSAIKNREILIKSPDDDYFFICRRSLFHNGSNYLYFYHEEFPFFLIQSRRSVDGFYFPKHSLFCGRNLVSIKNKLKEFISSILKIDKNFLTEMSGTPHKFIGIYASQSLPYHYFYDVVPALSSLDLSGLLTPEIGIFTQKKGSFLDLSKYYPCRCLAFLDDNSEIYLPEGIMLSALVDGDWCLADINPKFLEPIAQKILERSENRHELSVLGDSYPVIWIGILAGKRTWSEQVQAISNLIRTIRGIFPNSFFVFDGITSTPYIQECSAAHEAIIDEILKNVANNFPYINLNGKNSELKILTSSVCSFYISDAATASMYPARFCHIPGVAFAADGARIKSHSHPNTTLMPTDSVSMINPDKGWEYSDLSIEPNFFHDFVVKSMLDILN
jgi:hypothetical protein